MKKLLPLLILLSFYGCQTTGTTNIVTHSTAHELSISSVQDHSAPQEKPVSNIDKQTDDFLNAFFLSLDIWRVMEFIK